MDQCDRDSSPTGVVPTPHCEHPWNRLDITPPREAEGGGRASLQPVRDEDAIRLEGSISGTPGQPFYDNLEVSSDVEEAELLNSTFRPPPLTPANTWYSTNEQDQQPFGTRTDSPDSNETLQEGEYESLEDQSSSITYAHDNADEHGEADSDHDRTSFRSRSASLPTGRQLKSALHSPVTSPAPSGNGKGKTKKVNFDDENLETEHAIRRAATDPWHLPKTLTTLDMRRLSAPPTADDDLVEEDFQLRDLDLDFFTSAPQEREGSNGWDEPNADSDATNEDTVYQEGDDNVHESPERDADIENDDNDPFDNTQDDDAPRGAIRVTADESRVTSDTASSRSCYDGRLDDELRGLVHEYCDWRQDNELTDPFDDDRESMEVAPSRRVHLTDETGSSRSCCDRRLDSDSSNHHHEAAENDILPPQTVQEWSGEVEELPAIKEAEDDATSREETIYIRRSNTPKAPSRRRSSDLAARVQWAPATYEFRRTSSMTEVCRIRGRLKVPVFVAGKASPASPAMSACSIRVAEPPRLNTVYEYPTERYRPSERDHEPQKTAHTVQSDHGTYQMLWEDPAPSSSDSAVTLLYVDPGVELYVTDDSENQIAAPSPLMEKVTTRLRAWSWERQLTEDTPEDKPRWLPLMDLDEQRRSLSSDHSPHLEHPPGPPNTARHSGQSSAKHSEPQTPLGELEEDDGEEDSEDTESPLQLNVKALLSKPHTAQPTRVSSPSTDYLTLPRRRSSLPASPSINRELSNLGAEEIRFRSHRDSVEITQGHLRRHQEEGKLDVNSQLANARDSFVLARNKFESRFPRSAAPLSRVNTWSRMGGLSPIMDASPPKWPAEGKACARSLAVPREPQRARTPVQQPVAEPQEDEGEDEDQTHPDEHKDCPLCEEHRPRWFEAKHRKW